MFKGAYLSIDQLGSIREVTVEFQLGLVGRLLKTGSGKFVFRNGGHGWYFHPSGIKLDEQMASFAENVWTKMIAESNPSV